MTFKPFHLLLLFSLHPHAPPFHPRVPLSHAKQPLSKGDPPRPPELPFCRKRRWRLWRRPAPPMIAVHRSRVQLRDLGGAHSHHVHVDHRGGICCAARVWCADLELCRPLFRRLTTACGVGRVGMTVPFGDILHSSQTEAGD